MKDPFDDAPLEMMKPERRLLEKDIQKACVDWARENGWWARKFSSPANRSVPDYLFARIERGYKLAVEFKAPGKKPTDAQVEEQELMRAAGWTVVAACDNIEWFKDFMRNYV